MTTKKTEVKKDKEKNGGLISTIIRSWKILLSIGIALSFVSGVFTFDSRYYKTAEAQQQKQETIKTFEQFQKSFEMGQIQIQNDRKKDRLESQLRDLKLEQKLLLRRETELNRGLEKDPKSLRFKEDLLQVRRDLDENRSEIEEVKKQLSQIK